MSSSDKSSHLEAIHQQILDAAGEGIYGLDTHDNTTFGNAATSAILGWRVDEILGQKAHEVHR